jgi:hypothetical protein
MIVVTIIVVVITMVVAVMSVVVVVKGVDSMAVKMQVAR